MNKNDNKILNPVESWLGRMNSEQTKQVYRKRLAIFCDWSKLNPEQLLALKDNPSSLEAEHLLDSFVASPDFSDWQKVNIVTAIKSFYKYSYRQLQRISGKVSAAKQTPYRTPTKETLRKFIDGAWSHRDKALVAFIASSFFREGTIAELNWGDIEDGALLEDGFTAKDVLHVGVLGKHMKGGGKGRYAGIQQHTFLTAEACNLLMKYKRSRTERGEQLTNETPLFVTNMRESNRNNQGNLIGYKPYQRISVETIRNIFKATSRHSGIKFSPHDFRRYGQTQLEEAGLVPNWIRKILGHKVTGEESPYSRPKIEQLRKAYQKALPHLIFLSAPPTITPRDVRKQILFSGLEDGIGNPLSPEARIKIGDVIDGLIDAGYSDIQIKELLVATWTTTENEIARRTSTSAMIRRLKKWNPKETSTNNCPDGNCQRIVGEEELPPLLAEGWHVAAVLPSRRIVICNEG